MKNEGYISNTQNLLSNETSQKMAKEVSWKYHKIMEMHHKNTNKKRKRLRVYTLHNSKKAVTAD